MYQRIWILNKHETSWGIGGSENRYISCNGKYEYDKSNVSFLYSYDENEIDMLKNRKYEFSKKRWYKSKTSSGC